MSETLFPLGEPEEKTELSPVKGKPRLVLPNRTQIELRPVDLEGLLPADHMARAVWEFVESLDLGPLYEKVQSVEGVAGRPAIDPRIFLGLWLYAILEGVGSARALERLTRYHDAYRWIAGGVSVNYHSLSDFRVGHGAYLEEVLTHSVAVLMAQGLVKLNRVSQDGIRVRASAGAASFRREERLEQYLKEAEEQVRLLRQELEENPEATSRRQAAAREHAAEDRRLRVKAALAQMPDVAAKKSAGKKDKARVSTTDAEARVMKMGDGGFRPAYNGQFAVDTETQIVVGVGLCNSGSDQGQMVPMIEQLEQRYGKIPSETLVDGGFAGLKDIEKASELGTEVYAPVAKPKDETRNRYVPLATDAPSVAKWRERMGMAESKEIYKQRASTVECVNALARNRGLQHLLVRGQDKVRTIFLWFGIAHNLMRTLSLNAKRAAAA